VDGVGEGLSRRGVGDGLGDRVSLGAGSEFVAGLADPVDSVGGRTNM
jgi:hypothetical protein